MDPTSDGVTLSLNPKTRTLRVGRDNPVALRAKSFHLLEVLAEAAPDPVDKDTLVTEVWGGRAVSDDSIVQCVKDIRRAIGVAGHAALQTLPGLGYCLAVPVADDTKPIGPRAPGQGVAVLPFDAASSDGRLEGLAQGMMLDLVHALSQARVFRVVTPPDPHSPPPSHRHRVTGSIQEAGDALRIVAILSDAATGECLWTKRWEGAFSDYFAIQDKVVADIANALANSWSGRIAKLNADAKVDHETHDLDAYAFFQRGVASAASFTPDGLQNAVDAFQNALALDPQYGEAWACLSITYALMSTGASGDALRQLIEARLDTARRAYACHPRSPWALAVGAWIAAYDGDMKLARERLDTTVAAAPLNADIIITAAGLAVLNTCDYDAAILWGNRALELNESRPEWYRFPIGYAHLLKGEPDKAVTELSKGPQKYPELLAWQAAAATEIGDTSLARHSRAQLLTYCPDWTVEDYLRSEPFGPEQKVSRLRSLFLAADLPERA